MSQKLQIRALLKKIPLRIELAEKLDVMLFEWAFNALKRGESIKCILKKADELEAGL